MRSPLAALALVLTFVLVFTAGGFIMGWDTPMWPAGLVLSALAAGCGFVVAVCVLLFAKQERWDKWKV